MPKFPFAAVAGQAQFKQALLLAAVNPLIGGVLVSGPRGCAKSTLAKALADILPNKASGFVTLPLGATEDMLIGTLNLEQVLNDKQVNFQPGLLAKAHCGVLYVDEVNLLADNLVDQLLDVAASGKNIVERDGISHEHDAQFILLGTMNPDEGELRPQLMDRFGLSVELSNDYSVAERIDIVKRREAFDLDEQAFAKQYQQEQTTLAEAIASAQHILPEVLLDDELRLLIAKRCDAANVDGLRADIVWGQAAKAQAALSQRKKVEEADVLAVEVLVLNHRTQQAPPQSKPPTPPPASSFTRPENSQQQSSEGDWGAMDAKAQQAEILPSIAFDESHKPTKREKSTVCGSGYANNRKQGTAKGGSTSAVASKQVNWFGSLVKSLGSFPPQHLVFRQQKTAANTHSLILLDTSASVLEHKSFAKAKGLILQLANQAYLQREQIALIGFGNQQVKTLLGTRRAPKKIKQLLDEIKASGGTPLKQAITFAKDFQTQQSKKQAAVVFKTYILTDGRVSQDISMMNLQGEVVVVDVEQSQVKRGKAKQLADSLRAQYYPLPV